MAADDQPAASLREPPSGLQALLARRGAGRDGVRLNLDGMLAGPEELDGVMAGAAADWRDGETGGLDLKGAALEAASLNHADLSRANLRDSDLTGAQARRARFDDAVIEQARFTQADCGGASFGRTHAGEASFARAMLEDAHFERASLRFADLRDSLLDGATFRNADLWGAKLDGCDADEASFGEARLDEASLVGGNFSQADFSNASLKKAKLDGARLRNANLLGARLEGATLRGADLSHASLARVNLTSSDLDHVRLAGAWLENTRMRLDQLGGAVGEERDGDYAAARQAYVALEQNFRSLGDSEGESWAFRKSRAMARAEKGRTAVLGWHGKHWRSAARATLGWLSDSFVAWLCDYGESLWRVVRAFFTIMAAFALLYGISGSLTRAAAGGGARVPTRDPFDVLVFSFTNMLSTSAPDIGVKPANEAVALLVSLQGAVGIVLIGLFGYVLGNRMHR